jgi:uncharacterized protein YqgC (DUF456 family)
MAFALLLVVCLLCLFLVPLGLPGIWVMIGAALVYDWLVPTAQIGWVAIGTAVVLGVIAEVIEFSLSARYAKKYGGSRRAGWGAIIGGIAGALIGVPVPIIGSVIGSFVGSFAGALIAEFTRVRDTQGATRVATGALIGRVMATAAKMALACAMAAVLVIGAWS